MDGDAHVAATVLDVVAPAGVDRAFELTLWHALQVPLATGDTYDEDPSFRTGLSLSYVWH